LGLGLKKSDQWLLDLPFLFRTGIAPAVLWMPARAGFVGLDIFQLLSSPPDSTSRGNKLLVRQTSLFVLSVSQTQNGDKH
jgi:hypothetical protein